MRVTSSPETESIITSASGNTAFGSSVSITPSTCITRWMFGPIWMP
jgi:hypothetical protein